MRVEARHDLVAQCGFAAEQVCTAADIQEKTIGRIEHDHRREALTPSCDVVERAGVFVRLGFDSGERGMNRTGVGKRHGELEPQGGCACVNARQQESVGFLCVDGERASLRRLPGSDQPVCLQTRQNDR